MGCNATFAIAANETDMNKVVKTVADYLLTERDAQKLLAKNLKDEAEAGNLKNFYLYSLEPSFNMEAFGTTYVTYFTISGKFSSAAIGYFNQFISHLPEGEYGVGFAFAWDHEPEAVSINGPEELYCGGGQDISDEINYLSEDFFWNSAERSNQLRRKGWRLKDMVDNTDYVTVAQAISLRRWHPERD